MTPRNLLQDPLWEAGLLGQPLPASPHAVSVALPRWADVVGYEEKSPAVMARLTSGYPRFVVHPLVRELGHQLCPGQPCLPFPSSSVAAAAAAFVESQSGEPAALVAWGGVPGVATSEAGQAALRAFWQHTGLIVSSREAEARLAGRSDLAEGPEVRRALRRLLAGYYDCGEEDVFLAPSGMAAQHAVLRAVLARTPGLPTAQLGFPYVDTLKLQQKLGHGGLLLHDLATLEQELESLLARQGLAACFCEIPGNPLLGSVNVRRLVPLLRARQVPLVADDVVATPFNVDLTPHADLIATSLTKFFVGSGDAMGGAVICSPRSPLHRELRALLQERHEELLWGEEARVLLERGADFPERMARHNRNGAWLAERLRHHPAIERVWYPQWESAEAYEAVRRPGGGWGSLITFLPKSAAEVAPGVYDRMALCKGPSLGTVFTLACPFTLLAHYTELEWAETCGVSRYLIRLSAGLEDPGMIWEKLERALDARAP